MKVLRNTFLLSVLVIRHTTVNGQVCTPQNVCPKPPEEQPIGPNNYPVSFDNVPLNGEREPFNGIDQNPGGSCGLTCVAPSYYPLGLLACLRKRFEVDDVMPTVQVADSPFEDEKVFSSKVVFSPSTAYRTADFDQNGYNRARAGAEGSRLPAAILYAENTQDVKDGVNCAVENGFRISARGRGHGYDATSTLDGTLVIDLQLNCKMEDFVAEKNPPEGANIIGAPYVGSIRSPSGCTNAVFMSAVNKEFKDVHGLGVIGSCPSVGITGFFLNGGYGNVTPYAGLAADLIDEIKMVLYDGTLITASATEHEDIFWASKGGTGGLGVITSFRERIPQSPSETYTFFVLQYKELDVATDDLNTQVDFLMKFQEYLFNDGTKFGGGFIPEFKTTGIDTFHFTISGLYLGTVEAFLEDFGDAGLLNDEFLSETLDDSYGLSDGKLQCGNGLVDGLFPIASPETKPCPPSIPQKGFTFSETKTQAEAEASNTCIQWMVDQASYAILGRSFLTEEGITRSICDELEIDQSFCGLDKCSWLPNDQGIPTDPQSSCYMHTPNCVHPTVIEGILKAFAKPQGFVNRKAITTTMYDTPSFAQGFHPGTNGMGTGGLMLPSLQPETFKNLLKTKEKWEVNHFVHGAPIRVPASPKVSSDTTGYPNRNTYYNLPTGSRSPEWIEILLQDPAFSGDVINVQIYGNYAPSTLIPNYERHVYGEQLEELARIRSLVDPLGMFDSPRYPAREKGQQRTVDPVYWTDKTKRSKRSKSKKAKGAIILR